MASYTLSQSGSFRSVLVRLAPEERFYSEAGAMYRCSSNIRHEVTTRRGGSGGILGSLRRKLAAETFFVSTYVAMEDVAGEVGLAPTLAGDLAIIESDHDDRWLCSGGGYLASSQDLVIDTAFQGLRGIFGGEGISFISVEGRGQLIVNAFGAITPIDVDGSLIVDTGHVVAFEDSLTYTLGKAASGWIPALMSAEGVVLHFKGQGRLYVQSHDPQKFGTAVGAALPHRME